MGERRSESVSAETRTLGKPAAVAVDETIDPGTRCGRYVLLERVGMGGMGVVYAAFDPELDRKVALKLLRPDRSGSDTHSDGAARLLREAQAMAKLAHPNVIPVYDVGMLDERVFVAMEFVAGQTLRQWIRAQPRSWRDVVEAFVQAGRGLKAAHAAELVHRDFKPSNVLVGEDGRIRVLDFGLARLAFADPESVDVATLHSGISSRLTETGVVMGTPAYMSPEQHLGKPSDARSDQFSFCVALYEALYSQRPFEAATAEDLVLAVGNGAIRPVPSTVLVPSWLRRAVERGLAFAPDARWPSMDALLTRLDRSQKRSWTAAGLFGGAAVGIGVAWQMATPSACDDPSETLEGAWTEPRRQAVEGAFVATELPFAADSWERVSQALDLHASAWADLHRWACEQSGAALDLRMQCLSDHRRDVDALVAVLADADHKVVERSVQAIAGLPDIDRCRDADRLGTQLAPPSDPRTAAEVEALRERLAQARALLNAGRYPDGRAVAAGVVEDAGAVDYQPLHAEALHWLGRAQERSGEFEAAEHNLSEAAWEAAASRHERINARAAVELVLVTGDRLANAEAALKWARHAEAALERGASNERLQASLLNNVGNVMYLLGRYDDALALFERALAIFEQADRGDVADLYLATTINNIGNVHISRGDHPRAREHYERVIALRERVIGPGHPSVASSVTNLATTLYNEGRYRDAREQFERALGILEGAFDRNHPTTAATLNNLANVARREGNEDDAAEYYTAALEGFESAHGPSHPNVAMAIANLGTVFEGKDQLDEALAHYQRALAIFEGTLGPGHPHLASMHASLGSLYGRLGDDDRALAYHEQSLALAERSLGPNHLDVALALTGLGALETSHHRARRAVALLDRAVAILESIPGVQPRQLANARFNLADAIWIVARDRPRALALAHQAHADLRGADSPPAEMLARIEQWLTARE